MTIQDSGERRQFDSGAVRDIQTGKGRCDLLPIDVIADLLYDFEPLRDIAAFVADGDTDHLLDAARAFIRTTWPNGASAIRQLSKAGTSSRPNVSATRIRMVGEQLRCPLSQFSEVWQKFF